VFLARLAGVIAFDPNGDQVGRIREVVITPRIGASPRVVGLILEVPGRRRVFMPIGRVKSFDANQVIISGVINMRSFRSRPGETLVFGELLDRKVTLLADPAAGRETDEHLTLVDIGITYNRFRDWEANLLYLRRGGSGFRRKGESFVVKWDDVKGVLHSDPDQGVEHILATLDNLKPPDVAAALRDIPVSRRTQVIRGLSDERLADVMEEMADDERVAMLALLSSERAADVLEDMEPDDAADLVSDLDPDLAADLLELMEPDEAEDIRRLMVYEENSAGGMMTTEPIVLAFDATVAEALAAIGNPDLSPALASQVYVVRPPLETPTGRYLGSAHFQRLLREPPGTLVSSVVDSELDPVTPEAPLSAVTRAFATYNLVALAVVDEGHHLLGAVTFDDVIDHMLPADWRQHRDQRAAEAEGGSDG